MDTYCQTAVIVNAETEGVYLQSDGSLAVVDNDASKGFVYLWVHLSFAFFKFKHA